MHSIKYYVYRFNWWLAKYMFMHKPTHVDIELTSACNLRCTFCPQSEAKKDFEVRHMPPDLFNNIIDELVLAGVPSIKLNLRGEPTLHPHFLELLEYTAGKFVDIRINTNGNYSPHMNHMLAVCCTNISFSINEFTDKAKYNDEYSLLEENIRQLYAMVPDKLTLSFVVTKDSKGQALIDYFKSFYPLSNFFIRPAMERTGKNFMLGKKQALKRKNCYMPNRRLVIAANGDVYPCCVMWHKPFIVLGNILKDSLFDIWFGVEISILRMHLDAMHHAKHQIMPFEACQNCESAESYVWE